MCLLCSVVTPRSPKFVDPGYSEMALQLLSLLHSIKVNYKALVLYNFQSCTPVIVSDDVNGN